MRIFTFLFLTMLFCNIRAQQELNNALKSRMYNNQLNGRFDVLVQGNISKLISQQSALGITVKYFAEDLACVNLNVASISQLIQQKLVKYVEYIEPRKRTLNDTMIVRNRIKPVKLGQSPLTMGYDGTGVIMGMIDSGCDFNHPDFKDASGNTRIMYLWDQGVATPTVSPLPFGYGQEWTAAQINAGVCTHNDLASYGHGTHVTGIAAGNGLANGTHSGVASKADIIVVAVDFYSSGPTISDGVQYIVNKATAAGKPFVINASVGDYYGSHDGTNLEAKMIDALIAGIPGRAMIGAAGNAGNVKFHTKNMVTTTDTNFTWLSDPGSVIEYWLYADTLNIKNVKYSVGCNRPGLLDLGTIGFKNYNYGISAVKTDTLKYGGNRIARVQSSASINAYGVYELYVKILADSLNYLWRIESTGSGQFDAWNFDFVSSGLPTPAQYPKITKYTAPDTVSSMVSSFQCSDQIIAVANYVNLNRYYDVNNTIQTTTEITGNLADNSSAGPTRDNRIKPDVAATGADIFSCAVLSMLPNLIATAPQVVATGSMHVQGGGTSAASPVVAGLAALYMQAHPNSTNLQVKQAIKNCTYSDAFTGTLPNNKFGFGKLDGFATFTCALVTGIDEATAYNDAKLFPNPASEFSSLQFNETISGTLEVYNAIGKLVLFDKISSDNYRIRKADLKGEGIFFVTVKTANRNYNFKLIVAD
ncbi:MAG: S8 family peptidase [Bacteroidia bacterium]